MNPIQLDPQICKYIPTWYKPIQEYQQICQTESAQLDQIANAIYAVKENFYFQTLTESGIAEWESIFGIAPNPETENIAFRRARVLNRISIKPPFTLGFLYQKLDELIGVGEWNVTVDYNNYTLYIESAAQNFNYTTEVMYTVNKIKPAHIVYMSVPYVQSGILISETVEATRRKYNYHLGTWELGLLPFANEDIIGGVKLPETPSVQAALLEGIANYTQTDIVSARVNGTIEIDNIDKTVTGSTVEVMYTVTSDMTKSITQVELLDSSGTVLTSSTVYIPITDTVLLKHKLPIAEGVANSGS